LPAGKQAGILTYYQTQVNKKTAKNTPFFGRSERSQRAYLTQRPLFLAALSALTVIPT
jgi:hypothetical protein